MTTVDPNAVSAPNSEIWAKLNESNSRAWANTARPVGTGSIAFNLNARSCVVCGRASGDAAECTACAIAGEAAWKRRADR